MLFLIPIVSMASEELILPQYTEEYTNWLELSEEERQKTIEPPAYQAIETSENAIYPFSNQADRNEVGASLLPPKYQRQYYGAVKDQGFSNACWAYAAASMFDVNYYLTNDLTKKTFSNLHMEYITTNQYNPNGFHRKIDDGGNIQIALAYATNGMGVALESNMPTYNITSTQVCDVPIDSKVTDYIELSGQRQIKEYLYKYGVVPVYTFMGNHTYFSSSVLYGNSDLAYCCTNSNQTANHAVTLIGWNDEYTNSSFPGKKGAYIALNSYGTAFGNNGLYYIFYDDTFVNKTIFGATNMTDINYDYLYQHDLYGWTAECGYLSGTYAANVFQRQDTTHTEKLTEVSSYFPQAGNITIYINANGNDVKTTSATKIIKTSISQPGYHTIKLNDEIILQNEQFVIGIKYPGSMFAEIPTPTGWCSTATSNWGESFISSDGIHYYDMQQKYADYRYANACIKAFTEKASLLPSNIVDEYAGDLASYVFDAQYYAEHNPDVYLAFGYQERALRNHWNLYGKAEGRAASSIFNGTYYASQNADLVAVFGYDYIALYNHFMNNGFAEYRSSSPEYDGMYYKTHYGDLNNMTSMQLIRHYAQYGKKELRRASRTYDISNFLFDAQVYAVCNPDVVNVYGTNADSLKKHWYAYGIAEGRIASLLFDAQYYLKNNRDVANAYSSTNYRAAYQHFIQDGFAEGRQGNAIFSANYYFEKNGDIRSAFGDNYLLGLNHFVTFGKNEKRLTSSKFNNSSYQAQNGDLRSVFQENQEQYLIHYLRFGQNENRICL